MATPRPKVDPLLSDEDLADGDEQLQSFSHSLDFAGKIDEARIMSETKARARQEHLEAQQRELEQWRDLKRRGRSV